MIDVTCAIIRNEDEQVLIVQRGEESAHPMKWEFPGGKVHDGESEEDCIIREIREELSMDIVIVERLQDVEYDYGIKKIKLIPFVCDTLDDIPFLSEHIAYRWVSPSELLSADFSEADIPVARNYLENTDHGPSDTVVATGDPVENETGNIDIRSMIERLMSTREVDWLATSAIENPVLFRKLLEYSYSDDHKLAFHSSWILTKVSDRVPELFYPHLDEIVEGLVRLDNESAIRSLLRIISQSDIEKLGDNKHGVLADYCFSQLRSGFSAIALKVYSMEILYRLIIKYPDLKNELVASIQLLQSDGSGAIISRGRQILGKLSGK
jgi:8-oxo-dGTP diphosphatase